MSIPPLVCSTPPPPDQCDDEKLPEDFDFTYNTSQEDETNDFDYEDYSGCSVFQSQTNMTITHELTLDNVYDVSNDITSKPPNQNDIEISDSKAENQDNHYSENFNYIADTEDSKLSNNVISKTHIEDISFELAPVNTDIEISCQITLDPTKPTFNQIKSDEYQNEEIDTQTCIPRETDEELIENKIFQEQNTITVDNVITNIELCQIDDDDFGDFEDCQSIEPSRNSEILFDECSNPWEQNEPSDSGFGDFKANFDEPPSSENIKINPTLAVQENENVNDDDDFGDFDDFQSSSIAKSDINMQYDNAPQQSTHIDLPGNETHVINEINKVLTSMFSEEIPKPESSINGNLDSLLCETWGHLMDVDERQPYIVSWNNCLGQKTLLKALCIDSRNILYGPKWSINMPKYAATLNNTPLQPKKQVFQVNPTSTESTHTDKSGTKPTTSWVDPFKSEGQESCTSEPENRPCDVGEFDAISTKPDKVYSETLGVQPIRQINLPDTHIFTPSDSETPRSKTIHYNSSPPVLLPQSITEQSNIEINIKQTDNEEYSDFQDFTTHSSMAHLTSKAIQQPKESHIDMNKPESASNPSHGLQILQPIKIEPIIPTLNWPDPGEVKETFDDFADFVSSTTVQQDHHIKGNDLSAEKTNTSSLDSISFYQKDSLNTSRLDDFDTFQSALPSKPQHEDTSSNNNLSSKTMSDTTSQIQTSQGLFQKLSNNKTIHNTLLQDTMPQSMPMKLDSYDNGQDLSISQPRTMVKVNYSDQLQPTLAPSTQNQSHQILQPLSLESYSQINWPNPGIDLQDLSRFNPVETLHSLKSDIGMSGNSKTASPVHTMKNSSANQADDDVWGEFMSSKPKQQMLTKKAPVFADDDEWTDFVSSPTVRPQNGLNTISLNVHTNLNLQKNSNLNKFTTETQRSLDIPSLNYITPKLSNNSRTFNDKHFQNL